ncbi:MAG: hypothetical protein WC374_00140 [Phycisphaerae bacterium]|jgi:hypothetical protein
MGDINQLLFVKQHLSEMTGPILEVGSKDYGNTQNLRALFDEKNEYIGIDMADGKGVDIVIDLTKDFDYINSRLKGMRFRTIFCLSVIEHCEQPFKLADNLTRLLEKDGLICVSCPFSWKVHAYPNDYWRFTAAGIEKLFPGVIFDKNRSAALGTKQGEITGIDKNIGRISFSFSRHLKQGHFIRGISANILKGLSHIGILRWLAGHTYLLAPTNIIMVGRKRDELQTT